MWVPCGRASGARDTHVRGWEKSMRDGHTRAGAHACPYRGRGGGVEQHGIGGIAGWGCGKRTTKKAGFPPP